MKRFKLEITYTVFVDAETEAKATIKFQDSFIKDVPSLTRKISEYKIEELPF